MFARYKWFGTDDDNENIKPYGQSTNNNDSVEIAWQDIMAEADVFQYFILFFYRKSLFYMLFCILQFNCFKGIGTTFRHFNTSKVFFFKKKNISQKMKN